MVITPRQREVYEFVRRFIEIYSYSPTIAEIGAHFGLRSPSTVHHLLSALEREGLIRRIPNAGRGIELVPPEDESSECEIPLLGVIAAGYPIEAVLHHQTVTIPPDMLGKGRTFALRVQGDSMIDEHICSGDFIIVESRQTAENGRTVVALVDGAEATVKRFYQEKSVVRLEPANPKYQPIIVEAHRVAIQGVVIGLLRAYAH